MKNISLKIQLALNYSYLWEISSLRRDLYQQQQQKHHQKHNGICKFWVNNHHQNFINKSIKRYNIRKHCDQN